MNGIPIDRRLPGAELVSKGLEDLSKGLLSQEGLLVAAASPRLRAIGIDVPAVAVEAPLHQLYELLASGDGEDAHARYNAMVGRIASFARAAEHAGAR